MFVIEKKFKSNILLIITGRKICIIITGNIWDENKDEKLNKTFHNEQEEWKKKKLYICKELLSEEGVKK